MKPTIEAMNTDPLLEDSIAHWERMATGKANKGEGPVWHQCALCKTHLSNKCVGCPVFKKTKELFCEGTPYEEAFDVYMQDQEGINSPRFQAHALMELEFLKSLRRKK